jgi:hypothetical protein
MNKLTSIVVLKLTKILMWLKTCYIRRALEGGVWIRFERAGWHKTSWANKKAGYLNNHYTGGTYHRQLRDILVIEEYPHNLKPYKKGAKQKPVK